MPRGRPRKKPLPTVDTVTTDSSEDVAKEVSSPDKDLAVSSGTIKTEDGNEVGDIPKSKKKDDNTPSSKRREDIPRCVCCKEPVYSGRRLNLSLLTTLAPYHFAVEEMQPYICSRCASDLGEVINKWLIKHGAEVKPYYKPEYMAKKYDENLNSLNKSLKGDNSNG